MRHALLALVLALLLSSGPAGAAPIAAVSDGTTTVTLYDEPCALKAVANLPFRATWIEGNQRHEGCYGGNFGVVLMYFNDRTVVFFPASEFKRVKNV